MRRFDNACNVAVGAEAQGGRDRQLHRGDVAGPRPFIESGQGETTKGMDDSSGYGDTHAHTMFTMSLRGV